MINELLSKAELAIFNRKMKYPLAIAEKDYFLAIAIKIVYSSSLSKVLIFKGGTALHHVYLPQLRFSEDLDFSTNAKAIDPEEIKEIFREYNFFEIKKEYHSKASFKIERLLFKGPLGQSNSIKIDIDFIQNTLLPPLDMVYKNNYNIDASVKVMDIREIAAEKIRAMSNRVRYRDFFDFTLIYNELKPDMKEVISLISKKEIRKPITTHNILSNWNFAKQQKENELHAIYCLRNVEDEEVLATIQSLKFEDFLPPIEGVEL